MKYMGSKARFAKAIYAKICELSPRNGRPWVEPFAGGMNMIANVPIEHGPRYANEINKYVTAMFMAGANGWTPTAQMTKEQYNEIRDDFNHEKFWNWVRGISKRHDVFVSEYKAPEDFECVWQSVATSSLSANGKSGGNKQSIEKLFRVI